MAKKKRRGLPRRSRGGDGGGSGHSGCPNPGSPVADGGQPTPPGYETKFAEFIRMTQEMTGKAEVVFVDHPAVLGDDYAELIESLSRLAEAELALRVTRRLPPRQAE